MIESYDKLTIGKYLELLNMEKKETDIDNVITMLSILTDMEEEEIAELPLPEFRAMVAKMSFLHKKPNVSNRCPKQVIIKGVTYNVEKDAQKLCVGQYIDYKTYLKEQDDLIKNLHHILTVFLIPKGKKYGEGYDLYELAETIKDNLDIATAIGISNFFFTNSVKSIDNILIYFLWKMRIAKMKEKDKETKKMMKEAINQLGELRGLLKDGYGSIGVPELGKFMAASSTKSLS